MSDAMEEADLVVWTPLGTQMRGSRKGERAHKLGNQQRATGSKVGNAPTLGHTHIFRAGRKERYQSRDKGGSVTENSFLKPSSKGLTSLR